MPEYSCQHCFIPNRQFFPSKREDAFAPSRRLGQALVKSVFFFGRKARASVSFTFCGGVMAAQMVV